MPLSWTPWPTASEIMLYMLIAAGSAHGDQ